MRIACVFPRRTNATPDDELAFIACPPPLLAMPEIDEVHVSVTFTWDIPVAERLAEEWNAVDVPVRMGGPAFGEPSGEFEPGMYLKKGYTVTSRGCPNHCWFCAVSKREGGLRELPIRDGHNVLDDNLLACSDAHVEAVFQMLRRQPERPLLTGGLEARLLKPWHARRLREIKAKRMYFAYDIRDDYEPLVAAGRIMREEGHTFESHSMCCYVLMGYAGDTVEQAEKRLADTVRAGFAPFPMLYRENAAPTPHAMRVWKQLQRSWIRPEIRAVKMAETIHDQRNSAFLMRGGNPMRIARGGMQSAAAHPSIYCPKCGKPAARKTDRGYEVEYLHFTRKGFVLHIVKTEVRNDCSIDLQRRV